MDLILITTENSKWFVDDFIQLWFTSWLLKPNKFYQLSPDPLLWIELSRSCTLNVLLKSRLSVLHARIIIDQNKFDFFFFSWQEQNADRQVTWIEFLTLCKLSCCHCMQTKSCYWLILGVLSIILSFTNRVYKHSRWWEFSSLKLIYYEIFGFDVMNM